jgi:hypothetical protein
MKHFIEHEMNSIFVRKVGLLDFLNVLVNIYIINYFIRLGISVAQCRF